MPGCHLKLSEAATAMQGALHGRDAQFTGVNTDTRNLQAGQLFIALQGPNFDGHAFVKKAHELGARAVVVNHRVDIDLPQIIVSDTQLALAQLAGYWRQRFTMPVVAITGSNGKTTVKEMLAAIFAQQGEVLATRGNLNNEIGVPLTLLALQADHQAAVIEEGASHPGDIAYLTKITQPNVAVVTNAASAHLEHFGSLETVARTKGEIFQHLPDDGVAVINADDAYAPLWRSMANQRKVVSFGIEQSADVRAEWRPGQVVTVLTPLGDLQVRLSLAGRHNVMNALAATAAAIAAGIPLAAIKQGLEEVKPAPGRLQWKTGIKGARVLDDTYNANPVSLKAALEVLAACQGDHYLALGDMAELGAETQTLHRQAGEQARESGVQRLYAVGENSRYAAEAFGDRAAHFDAQDELISQLRADLHDNVTLLVKGSRAAHMEKVVDAVCVGGAG